MRNLSVLLGLLISTITSADIREMDTSQIVPLVPKILERAEKGDADAQYDLSIVYGKGIGVDQNPSKSIMWLFKAAENNHPVAQNWLGYIYRYGRQGFEQDFENAIAWFRKSADSGFVDSMVMLALIYKGVSNKKYKDLVVARKWFRKAAVRENSYATFILGCYAYFGWYQQQDVLEGRKYFRLAAKYGDPRAIMIVEKSTQNAIWKACYLLVDAYKLIPRQ